jgi:NAD(P)-dependent dehydrogenase (short-subunit alcohol dehydrogenase family)
MRAGMNNEFSGRVAIVTGAGKGVGRGYAEYLAQRGAAIVVNNRRHAGENIDQTAAVQVARGIRAAGGRAIANTDSVEDPGSGTGMVRQALEAFGRLDIVIANAAVPQEATFHKLGLTEFRRIFDVGFLGTLHLLHAAWPLFRQQRYGRVVATSSSAGRYGNHGLSAYAASKGAIEMLVRSLAAEGASYGICANVISPYALSQMTAGHLDEKLASCLKPELVAQMVAWLASESCTANGEIIVAGGGRFRRGYSVETDSVSGGDMLEVFAQLKKMEGRPHPSSNHAFETLVEELKAGGQLA